MSRTRAPGTAARRCGVGAVAVVVAALALAAGLVPPAGAVVSGPTVRVSDLDDAGGTVSFVLSSLGLPSGVGLRPEELSLAFQPTGGDPVPLQASAQPLGDSTQPLRQTAVLAVDVSGSLGPDGIAAVRAAATRFLQSVPPEVEVGLVTFGVPPDVVVEPTTDHALVQERVDELDDGGGTGLYDAVALAVGELPGTGSQRIVLLTDGRDEAAAPGSPGSVATLDDVVTAVQASGAEMTAVGFGDGAGEEPLQRLAEAGRGQLVDAADQAALTGAFQAVADRIATDLQVTAPVPAEAAGLRGNLVVTVPAGQDRLRTTAYTSFVGAPGASPSAEPSPPPALASVPSVQVRLSPAVVALAVAAVFVALATTTVVVLGLVRSGGGPEALRRRNLSQYSYLGARPGVALVGRDPATSTRLGDNAVARGAVQLAGRVVDNRGYGARLGRRLESADVPLRAAEWVVLHVLIALGGALLLLLVSAGQPLAALVGLLLGVVGPHVYLEVRETRRRKAFLRLMPETLGLMASGLRAGYSMPQAIESVVREGQEPLRSEFNRALVETRLGVSPDDALEAVSDRMRSKDFRWVVMAIRIQREVGGNLSELLDTVSATLRERARLHRQVEVLSAEGRLSGWIISLLPVVFTLYLLLAQPGYLRPLWQEPLGLLLLGTGGVLFLLGVLGLRWAVKVEV